MATRYPAWGKLNAKQRQDALARWHADHGSSPGPPAAAPAAAVSPNKDPLYNPTAILSGAALKKAASELVAGQYQPQLNALGRQATNETTQGTALANRVSGYSQQVDKAAAVTQARQEAMNERLSQALDAIGKQGTTQADQLQAAEQARLQTDKLAGGTGGVGADAVANELAALRARQGADAQAASTSGAQTGADFAGLIGANRGALQLHGQEQQTQLANKLANDLAEIRAKRADLQGQRGSAFTKQLLDLRQGQFENQAVKKEYGLKQAGLVADVAKSNAQLTLAEQAAAANRANTAADNARADQSLATTEARDTYQRENHLGPYKPASAKSPAQETADARKIKTGVVNLAADYKQLLSTPDAKGRTRTPARVEQILRQRGAPPIVILAGADLAQFGYVRPEHLQSLRIAGVQIPSAWRQPKGAGTYKATG